VDERDLPRIAAAMRRHWSLDTCDPVDQGDWSPDNPSRGQCGVSALVLQELVGGELLVAQVLFADGTHQGVHYWNLLPSGTEVDLTRDQFHPHEHVQAPMPAPRTARRPSRVPERYERLRTAVFTALGVAEADLAVRFTE
jgi:hypothetical protein